MVVLQVKRQEELLFVHEAPVSTDLAELIPAVANLNNLRLRVSRLVSAVEDLIQYGPLKPESQQGYSEEQLEELSTPAAEQARKQRPRKEIHRNGFVFFESPDPTGRRVGEAPGDEAAAVLRKALAAATAVSSKDLAKAGKVLKESALLEALNEMRGALTIVYPEGLPECETVRDILDDNEDLAGTSASKEIVEPNDATLWWAGKELMRDKKLSDYTGKNDKCKIIVKIQKRGQGPPLREPPISEQQQKEMMAHYYRKQEEQKRLAENDEDDYLNSSWANTRALKTAFNGTGDVKWRPF
ncbi:hypothetical protein BC831DRAFT_470563 [Entophlyctis helioformis]|nr:hypothetical protein BC831DRAFT_470563 [Entophlyctis helioformis]